MGAKIEDQRKLDPKWIMLERGQMAEDGTQLLEELMRFKPEGLTANAWAVQAGVGRTIWADMRRHGNPSRRTLERLLEAAGSSLAEFEALRVGEPLQALTASAGLAETGRPWRQAPLPPLPLFESALLGNWGDPGRGIARVSIEHEVVIDRLPRPESLATDLGAYAVTIVSQSMWPRFRTGRRIAVSPASTATIGDDVLVYLAGDRGALIGELLRRSQSGIGLRQFNPPAEFELPGMEAEADHKIVGELI